MTLVIGLGNALRGDDAAGLLVAHRVGGLAYEGEATGLLDLWAGQADVMVVDAAVSGAPAGTVRSFDALAGPLPAHELRSSTHAFGLADAVELGRALGALPAALRVVAVEAGAFDAGAPLSAPVARAVDELVRALSG